MKIAFLFPGQGSQSVGMCKDIYDKYKEARDVYDKSSKILNRNIANLCFNSSQEELNNTILSEDNLEKDERRWYEISTSLYKLEDGFVGIKGLSKIYSEGTNAEDCCVKCFASEYQEIPSITYKRK